MAIIQEEGELMAISTIKSFLGFNKSNEASHTPAATGQSLLTGEKFVLRGNPEQIARSTYVPPSKSSNPGRDYLADLLGGHGHHHGRDGQS